MKIRFGLCLLLFFISSLPTHAVEPIIIDLSLQYNGVFWTTGDFVISSNTIVQNGVIKINGLSDSVVLKGENLVLRNVTIDSRKTTSTSKGIIELQNTNRAVIQDVIIDGENQRRAIYCNTSANDTSITNVDVVGKIAWGILFDDMDNDTRAVVNGYNYPIGSGLYITNYKFGHENSTGAGDAIEINCPRYRFKNIRVNGALVRRTNRAGENGLGIAFAQCSDVEVRNVEVYNTGHDGIHFEHSYDCFVENFTIVGSWRAIGVSHSKNVTVREGTVTNTGAWVISYNTVVNAIPMQNSTFENIVFDGCYNNGFLVSNAENLMFRNLTLKNYNASQNYGVIHFYNQSIGSVYDSTIEDVQILRDQGVNNPLAAICVEGGGTGNRIKGITSVGYEKKLIIDGNDFY